MKRSSNARVWKPARTRMAVWLEPAALRAARPRSRRRSKRGLLLAVPHARDRGPARPASSSVHSVLPSRRWLCAIRPEAAARMCAGRAVVALQPDDRGAREVLLEAQDVADLGAAPAVDRLVVVADAGDVLVPLGEQAQPEVLGDVGVLVLVDQDVRGSGAGSAASTSGLLGEQRQAVQQQVAEVAGVQRRQPLLVGGVELAAAAEREVADLARPAPGPGASRGSSSAG